MTRIWWAFLTLLMGMKNGTVSKEVMSRILSNITNDTYLLTLQILFQGFILQILLHTCELLSM